MLLHDKNNTIIYGLYFKSINIPYQKNSPLLTSYNVIPHKLSFIIQEADRKWRVKNVCMVRRNDTKYLFQEKYVSLTFTHKTKCTILPFVYYEYLNSCYFAWKRLPLHSAVLMNHTEISHIQFTCPGRKRIFLVLFSSFPTHFLIGVSVSIIQKLFS